MLVVSLYNNILSSAWIHSLAQFTKSTGNINKKHLQLSAFLQHVYNSTFLCCYRNLLNDILLLLFLLVLT